MIAGGILASVLASAAGGAALGGILGALVGLGIPEDEARYYEREIHVGRTLVTVRAPGRADEAREILRLHGADDMHTRRPAERATTERVSVPSQVPVNRGDAMGCCGGNVCGPLERQDPARRAPGTNVRD
jgi:hypothetical protein